jgi:fatty-acyl-CoA synthase
LSELLDPASYSSVVEPFLERAQRHPKAAALVLIENNGSERSVSVGPLRDAALAFAGALAEAGIGPGDIVILALRHSLDLIAAFWGILFRGAIPSIFPYVVPMPSPECFRQQITALVSSSGAKAVLTLPEFQAGLAEELTPANGRVLSPQDVLNRAPGARTQGPVAFTSGRQIAYLQYTSGTTGLQKGVLLSHQAILNFVRSFTRALDITAADIVVNWLPLYHDYGLFAGLAMPLLTGIPTVLMSPFKWVRNPRALLEAIHRHRGTLCWMPNSAYNHAVLNIRPADIAGLDLGSLRCLACGAEPVLYETQQRFLGRFLPFHFRESALTTGYGMAENTLTITISPPGRRAPVDWVDRPALTEKGIALPAQPDEPRSAPVVSCGAAQEGTEIMIVDENGQPLPERRVGEIMIRSDTLFSGYHGRPDLTDLAFRDGWFLTGDLGYMAGGHLHVCGRKKDLIIQAGHNIHPEDIEAVASSIPDIASGQFVAFGVLDERLGTEKIVLVCDLRRKVDDDEKVSLERELRRRVFEELEVTLGEVLLKEKSWVVRTLNGKIARRANLQKYLSETQKSA